MIKVCKFGGTSMADGTNMRRVAEIIRSDPARRYVVVSAPGKRYGGDVKITDLLYETAKNVRETGSTGEAFEKVKDRFRGIIAELALDFDAETMLLGTEAEILLHIKGLTAEEQEIILDGCLMNYYAKRN